MPFIADNLPLWLSYLGCGALLVLVAYLGGRRRRLSVKELERPRWPNEPLLCMRCGYDVRGLDGTICPECGTNYAETGLATARFRRWSRLPSVARVLIWTACVGIVGLLTAPVAIPELVPYEQTIRLSYRLSADRRPMPAEYDDRIRQLFGEHAEQRYYEGAHAIISADYVQRFLSRRPLGAGVDLSEGTFAWTTATVTIVRNDLVPLEDVESRWPTRMTLVTETTLRRAGDVGQAMRQPGAAAHPLHEHLRDIVSTADLPEKDALRIRERLLGVLLDPVDARGRLAATDGTFSTGTSAVVVVPPAIHRPTYIALVAYWPLVWLVGLPLVWRRRAVRGVVLAPRASEPVAAGLDPRSH